MITGDEKERDEISPEVKGKVQQVAFLLKTFFFLQASMKDERNKRFSVLFAAYRFPCFFFFPPFSFSRI